MLAVEDREQRRELGQHPESWWLQILSRHDAWVITGTTCLHLSCLLLSHLVVTLILSFGLPMVSGSPTGSLYTVNFST